LRLSLHHSRAWCFRDRSAETRQAVVRFRLPVRTAETLCGHGVPADRFGRVARALFHAGQLEGSHRVARALEKFCKLRCGFAAGLGLADTRLDLPPIAHGQSF
jgi:hypothetical protein